MSGISLQEAQDGHYAWILAGDVTSLYGGLRLPPAEIDPPDIINLLRGVAAAHRERGICGMWLVVHDGIVVGSCGYMRPVSRGLAEIGYGISPSWRGRGFASRAVAALIEGAKTHALTMLVANTSVSNIPSQRVLSHNGFTACGTIIDPEDGELVQWQREIL